MPYTLKGTPEDYESTVADLKTAVKKARAVALAFSERYTEPVTERAVEAIRRDPDTFVCLFSVLYDAIFEAWQDGERLEA